MWYRCCNSMDSLCDVCAYVHVCMYSLINVSILTRFFVGFKIRSALIRRASQYVGRKRRTPKKNRLVHPEAELRLSHMCSVCELELTTDTAVR